MLRRVAGYGRIPTGPHLAPLSRWAAAPPQLGRCAHCGGELEVYGADTVHTHRQVGDLLHGEPRYMTDYWHRECVQVPA